MNQRSDHWYSRRIASRIRIVVTNRLSHRPYLAAASHFQDDWIERARWWTIKYKTSSRVISSFVTRTDQAAALGAEVDRATPVRALSRVSEILTVRRAH